MKTVVKKDKGTSEYGCPTKLLLALQHDELLFKT